MSGLECVGRPSEVSHKQVTLAVTSSVIAKPRGEDAVKERQFNAQPRKILHAESQLVEDSGAIQLEPLFTEEPALVLPENTATRSAGVSMEPAAVTPRDPNTREATQPQQSSSITAGQEHERAHGVPQSYNGHLRSFKGAKKCAAPPGDPPPPSDTAGEDADCAEEEEDEEEGHRAPLELMAEFLGSVMKRDFQLANKLVQMILIYEPEHPEAQQFLPLIQEKLLKEQEQEDEDDGGEDDSDSSEEDDSESTGSDEETAQSSGSTSSSTLSLLSSSGEEEDK